MKFYKIRDAVEAFHYEGMTSVVSGELDAWMKHMRLACGLENDALALWSEVPVVVPRPTIADTGSWLVVENDHLRVLTDAEFIAAYVQVVPLEDERVTCDRCGFEGQLHRGESGVVCVVNLEGLKAWRKRVAEIEGS